MPGWASAIIFHRHGDRLVVVAGLEGYLALHEERFIGDGRKAEKRADGGSAPTSQPLKTSRSVASSASGRTRPQVVAQGFEVDAIAGGSAQSTICPSARPAPV